MSLVSKAFSGVRGAASSAVGAVRSAGNRLTASASDVNRNAQRLAAAGAAAVGVAGMATEAQAQITPTVVMDLNLTENNGGAFALNSPGFIIYDVHPDSPDLNPDPNIGDTLSVSRVTFGFRDLTTDTIYYFDDTDINSSGLELGVRVRNLSGPSDTDDLNIGGLNNVESSTVPGVTLNSSYSYLGGSYSFIDGDSLPVALASVGGSFDQLGSHFLDVDIDGNSYRFNITSYEYNPGTSAVPEPGTYAAIFGGAALLAAAGLRRRRGGQSVTGADNSSTSTASSDFSTLSL